MRNLLISLIFLASPALGQDIEEGGRTFFVFCASCHGDNAEGNGPMAEILTVVPPDLTQLAVENGGEFPTVSVLRQIDGRDPEPVHSGVMPAFGMLFEGEPATMKLPSGQPLVTQQGMLDLVAWLESVQVE
ncbi:c-type cytochrome [Aestuariibius sp. 2305UL40-4]|uniref:c-type cytochrome n=1 Tax=Aestuariibius violaceus TaxID=3234132 RepID=UPI00345EFF89